MMRLKSLPLIALAAMLTGPALAGEIADDLRSALEQIEEVLGDLQERT